MIDTAFQICSWCNISKKPMFLWFPSLSPLSLIQDLQLWFETTKGIATFREFLWIGWEVVEPQMLDFSPQNIDGWFPKIGVPPVIIHVSRDFPLWTIYFWGTARIVEITKSDVFGIKKCKPNMGLLLFVIINMTGWWFGCHEFYFPINIGILIIPIDELIFFQRGGWTTNQMNEIQCLWISPAGNAV